jgi:hypothetical protein
MTLEDLMAECVKANPEMHSTINGEIIKLDKKDYDKAVKDWANMRLEQIEHGENPPPAKPMVI